MKDSIIPVFQSSDFAQTSPGTSAMVLDRRTPLRRRVLQPGPITKPFELADTQAGHRVNGRRGPRTFGGAGRRKDRRSRRGGTATRSRCTRGLRTNGRENKVARGGSAQLVLMRAARTRRRRNQSEGSEKWAAERDSEARTPENTEKSKRESIVCGARCDGGGLRWR